MKHAYEKLVDRLRDARSLEEISVIMLAADIIERHGQLINRLKAAIGPALVAAAFEEDVHRGGGEE